MEELAIRIERLQRIIRLEVKELNDGGCIHFAYYFSKRLTELKVPHKIFFTNHWGKIDLATSRFNGVTHVMVYIEGIGYIDGYETINKKLAGPQRANYYKHSKPSDTKLNAFRNKKGSWNPDYNKNQNQNLESTINNVIYDRDWTSSVLKKQTSRPC